MNYDSGLSASDVALIQGRNNDNSGFGDGFGSFWVVLFILVLFGGWGNRGFGGYGFGGGFGTGSVSDNYVLASDFATLQRQIDSSTATLERKADATQQGLCDGFYAMNTGMLNGFSGVQQAMCQGFSGVNNAITTNGYETRLGIQGLSSDLASCCCDLKQEVANVGCSINRNIDSINYNMAMNTNQLQNVMCNNTRDIIESNNANYRALHDELVANKLEAKNDRIAEQQNEINALRLAASQERQNSFLISQLNPTPVPSYPVVNPNCCLNYQVTNGCCGNGCNCGNY